MDQPITRAEHISIHALREEGDPFSAVRFWLQKVFLSTPSARRATNYESTWRDGIFISIHALREEGDGQSLQKDLTMDVFLSTPSARRATCVQLLNQRIEVISIHALREEGDRMSDSASESSMLFLSTPSARRATAEIVAVGTDAAHFYPRPPRGGRPQHDFHVWRIHDISIHALREEGDRPSCIRRDRSAAFLSTPSARRATCVIDRSTLRPLISIHALREEGDRAGDAAAIPEVRFLSTPSARRATGKKKL